MTKKQAQVGSRLPFPCAKIEFIARGVLLHDSSVLLCRDVKRGYFALPGGHIEFGESASEALVREFQEECGVRVMPREILHITEHVFDGRKQRHHEVNVVFRVELKGAVDPLRIRSLEAKIALDWIDLASVHDRDVRPPSAKALLMSGLFKPVSGPEWVTEITPLRR